MFKTLLLLTAIGLAQARPNEESPASGRRYELHPDCPPIHEHYLIPHESDCTLFYYCEYGLKWIIPRQCAPGTHFSAVEQVCTHPFAAGCTLPGGSTTRAPPTGPCDPTTTTTTGPCATQPTTTTTTTTTTPVPTTTTPVPTTTTTTTTTPAPPPPTPGPATTTSAATEPPCDTDAPAPNPTTSAPTTTTLNPDDLLDNGCPADFDIHHLLPHETYCNKFYLCVFGEKVESICAEGTHFSFELQTCDWPHLVNCDGEEYVRPPTTSGPTGPCDPTTTTTSGPCATTPTPGPEPAPSTTTTTTPAPTTTTTTTTTTTPAPTTTTTTTTTTAPPQSTPGPAPPSSTSGPGPTTPTATEPPCDTDVPAPGPSTTAPTTTTLNPDDLLDNGCPADFDVHHLLPHETYCNKFYYCVSGEKVERICAEGTQFNFELQICDWPRNVNCSGEDFIRPPTSPPTNPSTTEGSSGGDDIDIGELLPNDCPADFDVHHLLPHETYCNKFYYCVFGEKVERICPKGTQFNFELQVCDWPQNVNCDGSDFVEGSEEDSASIGDDPAGDDDNDDDNDNGDDNDNDNDDDNDNDGDNDNDDNNDDDDDDESWEALPNKCPADFDIHHLLPHESDCGKFYYCVHGEKVERECPAGTHFNPTLQVCDWPQFAGCEISDGNDSGPGDNGSGDNDSGDNDNDSGGNDSGPGDNDSGDNDNDSGGNDSGPGDNDSGDNDNDSGGNDSGPGDNDSGDNDNDSGGNDSGPGDNDSGDNDNDSGGNDSGPGDNDSGDNDNDSGGNDSGAGDNDSGDNDNDSGGNDSGAGDNDSGDNDGCDGTCPVSPTEKCRDECNVTPWAHDSDCDKYWICNGDQPLLITCSEGLHFNPNTNTCDFNCNAGCVRRTIQATERVDGVNLFLPWDKIDSNMKKLLKSKLDL